MTWRHTLLFSVLALVGGFVGGQVGRPTIAQAQVQQQRNENQILVPNDGLRFVTEEGRTVAAMGYQAGNGFFALLDANGRPALTMTAAPGGTVNLRSVADGAIVEVGTPDGRNHMRMSANASGDMLEGVSGSATLLLANRGGTSQFSMPGPNGRSLIDLATTANGGQLDLRSSSGSSALTASVTTGGGLLTVRDAAGNGNALVSGAGQFSSLKQGKTVWSAPPTTGN
jgi:hypothetical protein